MGLVGVAATAAAGCGSTTSAITMPDGGGKPATWTRFTDKGQKQVWVASTAGSKIVPGKTPVMDVYVNSGKSEYALREVIHGQVAKYPNDSLPPNETQNDIADKSN